MCSFWFLALCGCLTKRRYIIVFTTMAMFYSFVLAFKWATAAHFSMTAAVLSALRLWSEEEETRRPESLLPSANGVPTKQPMISTFRNSIDQQ
ncbi:hypothetical protein ANCDUO_06782 [Ancylostoma duodenale]|uniref:Uncharacterized protein n=1 Tax=Ancylostoma duodenale TaxID=51022 RepID=A0A0C2H0S8_9BILA|nr:hypothetical protein ANCDUO_06782 [Ancylostoma duodenale]